MIPLPIVALSDLHLGQNGADGLGQLSLLSARSSQNLVQAFVGAVADFAGDGPIALLIAGDLLDLSIAYAADAIADFQSLIDALAERVRVEEIIYVIGNHDHHLWSLHSEDKHLLRALREGRAPAGGDAPGAKAAYHVTSTDGEPFDLLQPIVDRVFMSAGSSPPRITIAYPSYVRPLGPDMQLYVTHGHLFGGLYTELSTLLQDKLSGLPHDRVAATVNQPIIELVYWLLGETGEGLGADGLVEAIYTDMQKGSLSKVQDLVAKLVDQLLPHGVLWRVIGGWERKIVVEAVMSELRKALLSPAAPANASLERHADLEATRTELRAWLDAIAWPKNQSTIALYGHTHVWDEYAVPDTAIRSWNLGTWLVEPNRPPPRTGFLGIRGADARWVDVRP